MDMTQRADPAPSGETQQPAVDAATRVHLRALLEDTLDLAAILDRDSSLRSLNGGRRRLLLLSPGSRATALTVVALLLETERSIIHPQLRPDLPPPTPRAAAAPAPPP